MADYLVFRLYGALASWGDIAVGEVRPSFSYPSRSAIIGMVCAALGIRRVEEERLAAAASGYDLAIKVLSYGTILRDYHTVQAPPNTRAARYATRKDEVAIGRDSLSTMLTYRDYRCDAMSLVALKAREGAPYSLAALQEALERPRYALYLGRKSCPLSLPLKPQILTTAGFREAFTSAHFPPLVGCREEEDATESLFGKYKDDLYWEDVADPERAEETKYRYDDPSSRLRWQFAKRREFRRGGGGAT